MMFALRRAAGLVRSTRRLQNQIQQKRNDSFFYRDQIVQSKLKARIGNAIMFFTWYWMFYHIFAHTEHLLPHFPMPDPASWSDEELGIPPEDAED